VKTFKPATQLEKELLRALGVANQQPYDLKLVRLLRELIREEIAMRESERRVMREEGVDDGL